MAAGRSDCPITTRPILSISANMHASPRRRKGLPAISINMFMCDMRPDAIAWLGAPSPRLRGEGGGRGAFPQAQTRGEAPLPNPPPQAGEGNDSPCGGYRGDWF